MVAKVVKLAVIPAALGLASFRVYAMTELKKEEQISSQELSIYSTEPPALQYVKDKPGSLQTGLGSMRAGLQPYVRAVQNTCVSVRVGAGSLYQAGRDTYNFLSDPPPDFLPRVGIIAVSGLAGLVLARKGSRLKRVSVPLALMTIGVGVCYPIHTVRVLKVTGTKLHSASSMVASAFKSKPKEVVPDADLEHAAEETVPVTDVIPQPDVLKQQVLTLSESESDSEAATAPRDYAKLTDLTPMTDVALENSIPSDVASEDDSTLASDEGEVVTYVSDLFPHTRAPGAEVTELSDATLHKSIHVDAVPPAEDSMTMTHLPEAVPSAHTDLHDQVTPLSEAAPTCPPGKAEKPHFIPDSCLVDHGQSHPEDADLYSTRE